MITVIRTIKKITPKLGVKQRSLIKGIWKQQIALGLTLGGLAGLGSIFSIYSPEFFGLIILAITFLVFILTYWSSRDLEKDSIITAHIEKTDRWLKKMGESDVKQKMYR